MSPHEPAADQLRARLRADLIVAMKAHESDHVHALRTTLAAIDNAEAVASPDGDIPLASEHIAGAAAGVGASEARRRDLSIEEVRELIEQQINERAAEAEQYRELVQPDLADELQRQAAVLRRYLHD